MLRILCISSDFHMVFYPDLCSLYLDLLPSIPACVISFFFLRILELHPLIYHRLQRETSPHLAFITDFT